MAKRRSDSGLARLSAESSRLLSCRKSHPLMVGPKSEKARAKTKRRSVIKLYVEQNSENAKVEAKRRSAVKLTDEQKSEKDKVEAKRMSVMKLTV